MLCAALGYGLDGYGVGKMGGPEIILWDRNETGWKFMGDAAAALIGWSAVLTDSDPSFRPQAAHLGLAVGDA